MTNFTPNVPVTNTDGFDYTTRQRANEHNLRLLKAGDEVVLNQYEQTYIRKVMRVTPTQILIDSRRFARQDGREIEGGVSRFRRAYITTFVAETQARKAAQSRRYDAEQAYKNINIHKLSTEQIETLVQLAATFANKEATPDNNDEQKGEATEHIN